MKHLVLIALTITFFSSAKAQLYFPPTTGSAWETTDPATLGWCQDSIDVLYDYLEQTNSKAFILLKDGRIVLERYFGTFTADSLHVWNSAGKTLTAVAVGIAQQQGFLNIGDTTSDYLGSGWTSLTPLQEEKITIRHQLTMTSGLADTGDIFCTDPACLNYLADAGNRWAYHNGPYTLLDGVIEAATNMTLNQWVTQKIKNPTGMTGFFVPIGYNNIFISNARSMARFGLLLQNGGDWNTTPVLNDPAYFDDMTHPSQSINDSYGYLTWLNGQSSFMIPQSQFVFPGSLMPNAPGDVYAALGKDGQIVNVAPADGLVLIRMGGNDNNSLVSTQYNDTIWQYVNRLPCLISLAENALDGIRLSPNPTHGGTVNVSGLEAGDRITLTDLNGREINAGSSVVSASETALTLDTKRFGAGVYLITINRQAQRKTIRLLVN